MIPQSDIIEWSNTVSWQTNEQIEQDLVICRALVEIFRDDYLAEHLAFRGGTALHKLKLKDNYFVGDIVGLIRPDEVYDYQTAYELVKKELLDKM